MKSLKSSPKKKYERWVVKVGSQLVCSGGPLLLRAWMHQVGILKRQHKIEVIWVTSGAIASAVERTQFNKKHRELAEKQALSAIGQPLLMDLYNLSLQASGLIGAQILLSYEDLKSSERRENFQKSLNKLLEWDIIPIVNENDAVATEEIKFGDNDSLSAKVACAMKAKKLVIMSDVEGLYNQNPKNNPKAKLLPTLKAVTAQLLSNTSQDSGSGRGTGGMYSKLKAAKEANDERITTHIAKGDLPNVLLLIAEGKSVGTRIGDF